MIMVSYVGGEDTGLVRKPKRVISKRFCNTYYLNFDRKFLNLWNGMITM